MISADFFELSESCVVPRSYSFRVFFTFLMKMQIYLCVYGCEACFSTYKVLLFFDVIEEDMLVVLLNCQKCIFLVALFCSGYACLDGPSPENCSCDGEN